MYRIFLTNEFLKQIKKTDSRMRKGLEERIEEYISPQLKREPHFGKNVKKLRDYVPETWRYRIGNFRLFYIIDEVEKIVALISIDDRTDAYRKKKGEGSV